MVFKPRLGILPTAQRELWPQLLAIPEHFILYDGTAIALRLGHRVSVDFDFFTSQELDGAEKDRIRGLSFMSSWQAFQDKENTLVGVIQTPDGPVKLSFFGGLNFGRVLDPEETADGILRVASLDDLLGHKLKVILDRGEGKDYEDIAQLLQHGISLDRGMSVAMALFQNFPVAPALKALTYFEDINEGWRVTKDVKDVLIEAIRTFPAEITPATRAALGLRPLESKSGPSS